MSPVVLSAPDQLLLGVVWVLTLIAAYCIVGLREQDRHISTLEKHLDWLHGADAEDGQS